MPQQPPSVAGTSIGFAKSIERSRQNRPSKRCARISTINGLVPVSGAARQSARKGTAAASSFFGDRNPMKVFNGGRTNESWSLNSPSGWLETKWEPPVLGRTLLLVGRAQPLGHDLWGKATLSVNGSPPIDVAGMEASKVILIESPAPILFRSMRVEINGSNYPGLSSVEIHP